MLVTSSSKPCDVIVARIFTSLTRLANVRTYDGFIQRPGAMDRRYQLPTLRWADAMSARTFTRASASRVALSTIGVSWRPLSSRAGEADVGKATPACGSGAFTDVSGSRMGPIGSADLTLPPDRKVMHVLQHRPSHSNGPTPHCHPQNQQHHTVNPQRRQPCDALAQTCFTRCPRDRSSPNLRAPAVPSPCIAIGAQP